MPLKDFLIRERVPFADAAFRSAIGLQFLRRIPRAPKLTHLHKDDVGFLQRAEKAVLSILHPRRHRVASLADLPIDEIIAVADTVVIRPDPAPANA